MAQYILLFLSVFSLVVAINVKAEEFPFAKYAWTIITGLLAAALLYVLRHS
jgi:hypothetical protein